MDWNELKLIIESKKIEVNELASEWDGLFSIG